MDKFLNLFTSGAVSGGLYALLASGLVVSYSATGIFNFGLGAVAFTSAFMYYELHSGLHWSIVPAALVTIGVLAPLLGITFDRVIFRPLAKAGDAPRVMASIGVLVALPALAKWIVELLVDRFGFGLPLGNDVFVAPGIGPSPARRWTVVGVAVSSDQVIILAVAVVAAIGLWVLLRRTRLGLEMRALVAKPDLAQLRGVDVRRVSSVAWIVGTVLAATAGVVGAPIFNSLDPGTYTLLMFVAVAAAVPARLRSVPIAVASGLALGVVQNLVSGYATVTRSIPGFSASVPFLVLLVGLLVWNKDRGRIAGVATETTPPRPVVARSTARRAALPVLGATALCAYLFVADRFWVGTVTVGLALALVFLSFVLVTGLGGMVSLAQAAFVTCSGLVTGLLANQVGLPYLLAVAGGVLAAVLLGVVVALPALRLGGLALALATLALGFLGDRVLFQLSWLRNAETGWEIARPVLGPIDLADDRTMAFVLLALVAVVTLLLHNLRRGSTGRAILALRASEAGAAASGLSPVAVKLRIFALSAGLAGLGGAVLATYDQHAVSGAYPTATGLVWLASVVLWGVRRPAGAILAAMSAAIVGPVLSGGIHWPAPLPTFLSWDGTTSVWVPSVIFGLGAIQMAKQPDGILAFAGGGGRRRRRQEPLAEAIASSSAAPAGDAALELRDLVAGYGDVQVLHGVSLAVHPGRITALFGANGSGKSTLCSATSGLLPSVGEIFLNGVPVGSMTPQERAARGLFVVPESRGTFPELTVEENLTLTVPDADGRRRILERFPILGERRSQLAANLSGGEQQILSLAPVLASTAAVLIADEPTLGLAPAVVRSIAEIFVELRDRGTAVLLVEEKARVMFDLADDVALLERGRVVWRGNPAEAAELDIAASYLVGRRQ